MDSLIELSAYSILGIIANEISTVEISPADLTSQAIIRLFDKEFLKNQIYHVLNPNPFNLAHFFSKNDFFKVKVVSITHFIDNIVGRMRDPAQQALVLDRFLVHQGWLNDWHTPLMIRRILQITHAILQHLGFTWVTVNDGMFSQYLKMEINNVQKAKSAENTWK